LIYFVSYISKEKTNSYKNTDSGSLITFNSFTEKDSDGDGLKDWEEELWGTDVNNPDSDGDGTPDGEEISIGRNPTVAGPNDLISENKSNQEILSSNSKDGVELTKTEIFSRKFISEISNHSGKLDDQAISSISKSLVSTLVNDNKYQTYTISDLNIINASDKNSLKVYGNKVGEIKQKYIYDGESELEIIKRTLETEDYKILGNLDIIITYYQQLGNDLLETQVPRIVAQYHVDTINALVGVWYTLMINILP